jgi:hypothetical protein
MKVISTTKLEQKYDQYDISTGLQNFYVKVGEKNILVHNSPAVFAGTDPADGKFFVGTKAIFNKEPKLIKEPGDVDKFELSAGLKPKLLIAFRELSRLKIPRGLVLQGDILFTAGDIENKTIDGENYITFQPNTIMYSVPASSELAHTMVNASLGIIFHTTYTGTSVPEMKASFGADVSKLKRSKTIWFDDASYKDYSSIMFSGKETAELSKDLNKIQSLETDLTGKLATQYREYHIIQRNLKSSELGAGLKTFFNKQIRVGKLVKDGKSGYREFIKHFESHFEEKVISKLKSDKAIEAKRERLDGMVKILRKLKPFITKMIEFTLLVMDVKNRIIRKLESGINKNIKTFVVDDKGIRITNQEGFVAIDKLSGGAVKFVDRLEFSNLNFNVAKNWTK